jgi:hypothetical protein
MNFLRQKMIVRRDFEENEDSGRIVDCEVVSS